MAYWFVPTVKVQGFEGAIQNWRTDWHKDNQS